MPQIFLVNRYYLERSIDKQQPKKSKEEPASKHIPQRAKVNLALLNLESAGVQNNENNLARSNRYTGNKLIFEPDKNCKWNMKPQWIINLNMSKEDQIDENPKSASRSNSASQRWSPPFSGNTENDCNPYLAAGSAVKEKGDER